MNRMLQGEVGSGKTIVSVLAMLQMIDAGYQCALLAPTEVLAAQHARSIRDVLGPLAMAGQLGGAEGATRVALLTGSMSPQQKRQVRDEVAAGEAGIVIGTHALLQDAVEFQRLGMVVVDEQHRFGVEQRDRLRAKAPAGMTPHLLVMTATPIPRTVALTVYGDLETSTLRELPRGRQPITTNTIFVKEKPAVAGPGLAAHHRGGPGRAAGLRRGVAHRRDRRAAQGETSGPPATTVVELFDHLRHGPLVRAAPRPDARPAARRREGRRDGRVPGRRDRCPGVHHRHRGRCRRAQCHRDVRDGRRPVRHQPAASTARPHRPRRTPQPVPARDASCRRDPKRESGSRRSPARWTVSSSPTSISRSAAREMCWASASPAGRSRCGSCRWPSISRSSRRRASSANRCTTATNRPRHPGMALLAAQFTDTDRVEYLDKA